MFIEITRPSINKQETYWCSGYIQSVDEETGDLLLTLELGGPQSQKHFSFDKSEAGLGIHLKNDEGKTVETVFKGAMEATQ